VQLVTVGEMATREGGARTGMTLHLGKAHSAGKFADMGFALPVDFDMRPIG
jgi:hypothetical protein